jgi:hypothetical protein
MNTSVERIRKSPFKKNSKIQAVVDFEFKGQQITGYSKLRNLGIRSTDASLIRSARGQAIKQWHQEFLSNDRPFDIKYSEANKLRIKKVKYQVYRANDPTMD